MQVGDEAVYRSVTEASTRSRHVQLDGSRAPQRWPRLVTEAERIAKAHGCVAVQGTCLSFQAPGFFRKLGCEMFGTADVFLDGHTQDQLIKQL